MHGRKMDFAIIHFTRRIHLRNSTVLGLVAFWDVVVVSILMHCLEGIDINTIKNCSKKTGTKNTIFIKPDLLNNFVFI
jgi:hypothetical protein